MGGKRSPEMPAVTRISSTKMPAVVHTYWHTSTKMPAMVHSQRHPSPEMSAVVHAYRYSSAHTI